MNPDGGVLLWIIYSINQYLARKQDYNANKMDMRTNTTNDNQMNQTAFSLSESFLRNWEIGWGQAYFHPICTAGTSEIREGLAQPFCWPSSRIRSHSHVLSSSVSPLPDGWPAKKRVPGPCLRRKGQSMRRRLANRESSRLFSRRTLPHQKDNLPVLGRKSGAGNLSK